MDAVVEWLYDFAIVIVLASFIGGALACTTLIPPIRKFCQQNSRARVLLTGLFGFLSFLFAFGAYTNIEANLAYLWGTVIGFSGDFESNVIKGPQEALERKAQIVEELETRLRIPPPLRRACYTEDEQVCMLADTMTIRRGPWTMYLLSLLAGFSSALASSLLVWRFTRVPG